MKGPVLAVVLLGLGGACGHGGGTSTDPDATIGDDDDDGTTDASTQLPDAPAAVVDLDGDGLDDADELAWASAYRPFLSVDANDGCTRGGIVIRVHPHPDDPTLVSIIYDHLFETDCGLNGHVGDDEAFGVTIDPTRAFPAGLISVVAISHQNTVCQHISECGSCPGLTACDTTMVGGVAVPVVYSSKDKHGTYATLATCNPLQTCFDNCTLAPSSNDPPIVNAGEPGAHMITNLTTEGFINAANGWTETQLFDFNPWAPGVEFGTAGVVADDLVDPGFTAAACH